MKAALPLLLLALLGSACATSRMGQAEVRLEQGQPCFGVTADESRAAPALRLHAIVLSDASAQPVARLWTLAADDDAQALRLTPGRCVRYDERPPGYRAAPAVPLQPQRVYEVFVNATPEQGPRSRQGYRARFCLTEAGGAARVLALPPDATACR